MPGPPPPSKSYNLVLDTDSEDEDDEDTSWAAAAAEEERRRRSAYHDSRAAYAKTAARRSTDDAIVVDEDGGGVPSSPPNDTVDPTAGRTDIPTVPSESDEPKCGVGRGVEEESSAASSSKKGKKKRKKKKKKKKGKKKGNDDGQPQQPPQPQPSSSSAAATLETADGEDKDIRTSVDRDEPPKEKKRVTFGVDLTVREYPRAMGGDGVPNDGGWPLSLSSVALHQNQNENDDGDSGGGGRGAREYRLDLSVFESRRSVELRDRYTAYVLDRRRKLVKEWQRQHGGGGGGNGGKRNRRRTRSRSGSMCSTGSVDSSHTDPHSSAAAAPASPEPVDDAVYVPPNYRWESRQMDHKKKDRSHGGRPSSSSSVVFPSTTVPPEERREVEWNEIRAMGRSVVFRPLGENERKALLLRDHGVSGEGGGGGGEQPRQSKQGQNDDRQRRKRKDAATTTTNPTTAATTTTDIYSTTDVRHVRNELEQIRIRRYSKDAVGCSCRKFVLPQHKHNGKKSNGNNNDRRKVKEELRKRKIAYHDSTDTEELVKVLMEAVEKEGCCYGNDCECFRNGVVCQMDTCSCWSNNLEHRQQHHSSGGSNGGGGVDGSERHTIGEIQKLCGNGHGMYVVDFDRIAEHRKVFLGAKENGLCGTASKSP